MASRSRAPSASVFGRNAWLRRPRDARRCPSNILGLVAGKSIGIALLGWLAMRLNLGDLSRGVTTRHIFGIGLLGGMGFTMSMFIAGLGLADNPEALVTPKTAILTASFIAGLSGYLWLRLRP